MNRTQAYNDEIADTFRDKIENGEGTLPELDAAYAASAPRAVVREAFERGIPAQRAKILNKLRVDEDAQSVPTNEGPLWKMKLSKRDKRKVLTRRLKSDIGRLVKTADLARDFGFQDDAVEIERAAKIDCHQLIFWVVQKE